jgi:hypothetical protein
VSDGDAVSGTGETVAGDWTRIPEPSGRHKWFVVAGPRSIRMSRPPPRRRYARTARRAGRSVYEFALDVVLTGVAVIVPLVGTFYVLSVAFGFVYGALNPVVKLLKWAGLIA